MSDGSAWSIEKGEGGLIATAIHNGNVLRQNLRPFVAISDEARLREEDPWTGSLTVVAPTRIIARRSRFEVDLNRPRDKAVYREPQDSWGLKVWNRNLPEQAVQESLGLYDEFYEQARVLVQDLVERHGRVLVYDVHSYNFRRMGPYAEPDAPDLNPEVNVGTGTMDRRRYAPVVDRFIADLTNFDFLGRSLDVRENVRFLGGHFAKWLHGRFPDAVCVLSIEFKKFFMDEWKGQEYPEQLMAIQKALESTVSGVMEELEKLS